MKLVYNGRPVQITDYRYNRLGFLILTASYLDGEMEDLNDKEMDEIQDNFYDTLFEQMPKGTGY